MTLHLFNASHDDALASNSPFYCPNAMCKKMEADLDDFPKIWASKEDFCGWRDLDQNGWEKVTRIEPWGWDEALCRQLETRGVPSWLLPQKRVLQEIRNLSSRKTATLLLPRLRKDLSFTFGESVYCADIERLHQSLDAFGLCIGKTPWSCSGRGVFRIEESVYIHSVRRAEKSILKWGGIEIEPYYPDCRDFALEFFYSRGMLKYEGLSYFRTSKGGIYEGNLIASQKIIQEMIGISEDRLHALRQALLFHLPSLLKNGYEGYLSIDMMISEKGIHPCVEINLRRTMGQIALVLQQRSMSPSWFGIAEENGHFLWKITPAEESC